MANRRSTGWCARREPDLPELVTLATGTEVHMLRSSDVLEAEGIATRVVSMPCVENFAAQDDDYRDRVLPLTLPIVGGPGAPDRAGRAQGWGGGPRGGPAGPSGQPRRSPRRQTRASRTRTPAPPC